MKAQEHADGHDSPTGPTDHYRLLRVEPDAPNELVAEAYWYLASRLRAEQAVRRSAERELVALNAAYQVLAVAEQRHAYDAGLTRVQELRRERAEKAQLRQMPPFPLRLFKKQQRPPVDCYELLLVDHTAEAPLIARAYSILRTLHAKETGEPSGRYVEELKEARAVLLDRARRADYDESRAQAAAAMMAPSAPEAKPREKAPAKPAKNALRPTVKEEPPVEPATQTSPAEKRAGPGGQARAAPVLSRALVSTAKGSGRLVFTTGRLGFRSLAWATVTGGRGAAAAIRAGGRSSERLRHRQSPIKATSGLPDDRLLRDAAPVAAKIMKEQPGGRCLARLVVRNPAGEEEAFELGEEPVTLGSDRECDVRLAAEPGQVAPAHAQIWFTGERFVIRSLDPMHPTVLCGQRVNWAGLDDGDEIEIGAYRLRFEAVEPGDNPPDFLTVEHEAAASTEDIPERQE